MRNLFYPCSVWWRCFCCLVAPPFAVYDSLNQDERQHVTTFIANLAVFLTKSVSYTRSAPKTAGEHLEFDETSHCPSFKKLSSMMINFHQRTRRRRRHRGHCNAATTRERVLAKYSTMTKQWTSSYSRSESPSVAESTIAATASRSDIHDVTD